MERFKNVNFLASMLLSVLAFLVGGVADVSFAAAGDLADGGSQRSGAGNIGGQTFDANGHATDPIRQETAGIATETTGRVNADDDFYLDDVDKKIVKIRPMSTPLDQISRYASTSHTDSFVCKYYSVGTRPIKATLSENTTQMSASATQMALPLEDASFFTVDDTIRVVGVKAYNCKKEDGAIAYDRSKATTPDLVLVVSGINDSGQVLVYAENGITNAAGQPIIVPALTAENVTLIRMGKACGELDAQTGRFESTPQADIQYCQNFMMQVEQSFLDKIAAKEVNWGFSDLEEDAIYDMRLTQEESFLWGDLGYIKHNSKSNMAQWFTKGIWWMPSKDVTVGHWDTTEAAAIISDDDLINMAQQIFVGAGTGNKKKVILCGSDMLAAFGKIKSDKFRLVSTYEKWHLKFTSWETGFGTLNVIHHELFNLNGMSDCAFCLDPDYLHKRKHLDWSRTLLNLKEAGIRNTQAAVLQEISCLYLRYPNAHARMKLATAPGA